MYGIQVFNRSEVIYGSENQCILDYLCVIYTMYVIQVFNGSEVIHDLDKPCIYYMCVDGNIQEEEQPCLECADVSLLF